MKNIILSAYPKNAPIVDIETGKVFLNNEEESKNDEGNLYSIKNTATISFESGNALEQNGLKNLIDKYINDENESYLSNLVKNLSKLEDKKDMNAKCNMIIIYWSQSKHKHYLSEKSIKSKEIIFKFYFNLLHKLNENQRNLLIL